MGHKRHHAIIVTSWDNDLLEIIRDEAETLCPGQVTNIVDGAINLHRSFLIGPDGSNEEWDQSAAGDVAREKLISLFDSVAYTDGSNPLSYIELFYRDDEGKAEILNHN